MFGFCVMSHAELLCICVTILLLFPYQLLLSKLEVVLPKFALKRAYFFGVLTFAEKIRLVQLEPEPNRNNQKPKCSVPKFFWNRSVPIF